MTLRLGIIGSGGLAEAWAEAGTGYLADRSGSESGWTTIGVQTPPEFSVLEGRRAMPMLDAATRSNAGGAFERPR